MGTRRLFVGFGMPEETAERAVRLVRAELGSQEGVRSYEPADLHLTLCFLGETTAESEATLVRGLRSELQGLSAPELVLSGPGAFPRADAPRILWLGVEESTGLGRLATVRGRVRGAALATGWREPLTERGRTFTPHVTVARLSAGTAPERSFYDLEVNRHWVGSHVVLYESVPGDGGGYLPLESFPLRVQPG